MGTPLTRKNMVSQLGLWLNASDRPSRTSSILRRPSVRVAVLLAVPLAGAYVNVKSYSCCGP
jgi:hypothetical protein